MLFLLFVLFTKKEGVEKCMAILTMAERRRLEAYLRPAKQRELARMVAEYMERGAGNVDLGMPRGGSRRSDPTAMAVIRKACPPKRIEEAMKWLDVVDDLKRRYVDSVIELLLRYNYELGYGRAKTCRLLFIDARTFYRWQGDMLAVMAIIAASKGVFQIQKCVTNTG